MTKHTETSNQKGYGLVSHTQHLKDYPEIVPAPSEGWVQFQPDLTMGHFFRYLSAQHAGLEAGKELEIAMYEAIKVFTVNSENIEGLKEEDPPFWVVEFINESFSRYVVSSLPYFETMLQARVRLLGRERTAVQYEFSTVDYLEDFPTLKNYEGHVSFPKVLTASSYSAMAKAIKPTGDNVKDTFVCTLFRASLPLIVSFDIKGVSVDKLGNEDETPLVLMSWLAHIADIYLGGQLNQKKLAKILARK